MKDFELRNLVASHLDPILWSFVACSFPIEIYMTRAYNPCSLSPVVVTYKCPKNIDM